MLKDKSQKPTKKLPLKTLRLKELKQVNGGLGDVVGVTGIGDAVGG